MPIPHLSHKIHSPGGWQAPEHLQNKLNVHTFHFTGFGGKKPKLEFSWKKMLPYLVAVILFFLVSGVGVFAWASRDLPDPNKLSERKVAQSTKIYDRTGEHLLYEIHGDQKRTIIPLNEIPSYAVKATIALEDQHFYEHGGFSLWSMFRGVVLRVLEGKTPQGGSTLTQQLVKNAVLTNERSVMRKIKELILAYRIENKYSKDEILQMYFNEIPYGSTAYGIEAASQMYFGKSAKNISLAEAAVLAALPQRPSAYSPYYPERLEVLLGRQQYCLDQMVELGSITKEDAELAKQEKLTFIKPRENVEAPHFAFFVKDLLTQKYPEKYIEQGGLKIISTLDYDLQLEAEKIVSEQAEKNLKNFDAQNAAVVALDVKTGQILSMVGSKDFFDDEIDGQVNSAVAKRQPGSSFKPIVYTTAFANGYFPETILYDVDTVFPADPKNYEPVDYDGLNRGPVSLRKALAGSLNIPAVKLLYLVGIAKVLYFAEKLGYTTLTDRSRFGLSLVLGGGEVTLLEHTNAFATLAREGKRLDWSAVLELQDEQGKTLEKFEQKNPERVVDENAVRMTSSILSDNDARTYVFGASNYLTLADRPVAAKTGTTNDFKDAWTMGYTPQVAVGVWVGNNKGGVMKKGADGSQVAAPIWRKVMTMAVAKLAVQTFNAPEYALPDKPMLGGGSGYEVKMKINKLTGALATLDTPFDLIEEKFFRSYHSILHYVDKNDPLGPVPTNPASDPDYSYWEEGVRKWVEKNGLTSDILPATDNNPASNAIKLITPQAGASFIDNQISLTSGVVNGATVNQVEYYLNEEKIGESFYSPFNVETVLPDTTQNGQAKITVKAFANNVLVGQDSITINLNRTRYVELEWLEPANNSTASLENFPLKLAVTSPNKQHIKKIDFYFKNQNNQAIWIGYWENKNQASNVMAVLWEEMPPAGDYTLYTLTTDDRNQTSVGQELNIKVN